MIIKIFYKAIHHFFPNLREWFEGVKDPRRQKSCDFGIKTILYVGILVFLLKLGSRRKIDVKFTSKKFIKNLAFLSGERIKRCLHNSSLAYTLKILDVLEILKLRHKLINKLIRGKSLIKFRLFGYYMITLDMTGYLSFNKRHCSQCLKRKVKLKKDKEKVIYYHPVVEAKLGGKGGVGTFNWDKVCRECFREAKKTRL